MVDVKALTTWLKSWWKGDSVTASYQDMETNANRANQLVNIWHEKFKLLEGPIDEHYRLSAFMLDTLDQMVRYALNEKDKEAAELENRYRKFIYRWTLHDCDGERWSDHEWEPILIKDLAGIEDVLCLTCEELGHENTTTNICSKCEEYKCEHHTECAGCEL